jgi:hypothetical protein
VRLDVGADGPELGAGPLEEDAHLAVVGREDQDDPPRQEVPLDLLRGRHVTPVGVVGTGQRRAGAVRGHRHGARHQRAPSVRADDQARTLGEGRATAGVAADAGDPLVFNQHCVHGKGGPHLRAGLRGGLDQDAVENRPARCVALAATVQRRGRASQHDRAVVEPEPQPGGQPEAMTWSSSPHRRSMATPGGLMK